MFLGIKCYTNQGEWYINKPLDKNLQNIDRNETAKFGACTFCWSGEKTFNICIETEIYRRK